MVMPQGVLSCCLFYYEQCTCLYDECEVCCGYMCQCSWSLLKIHVEWFKMKCPIL